MAFTVKSATLSGEELFSLSGSFMSDLSAEDESMISGGGGGSYKKSKKKSKNKSCGCGSYC